MKSVINIVKSTVEMKRLYLFLIFSLSWQMSFAENQIAVGHFSTGQIQGWENKVFSGSTAYQIIELNGDKVLKAESHSGASGMFKKMRIDLTKTPYLNWRWRIDNRLQKMNEQQKEGDDYSARIYVVIDGGWTFWKTKAINYVWTANSKKGSVWANAFAGKNAMMIALRSSGDNVQTWYHEKRNVLEDLKQQFGFDFQYIDGVALMTDTDNSKGDAVSYYGDIYFSEQ